MKDIELSKKKGKERRMYEKYWIKQEERQGKENVWKILN